MGFEIKIFLMEGAHTSILNILIAYGALQAFFIALILIRTSSNSLFNRLFSFLLIIEGFTLIERLLVESDLIQVVPHLLGISIPLSFLKPPLMLFMALSITDKGFRIKKKSFLHAIPFVVMVLNSLPFYAMDGAAKLAWVQVFMQKIPSYQSIEFYVNLSFFAYIGIYIVYAIRALNQFRGQILNHALVNWYRLMLIAYSGVLFVHLLYFLIQPLGQWNFAIVNQISMLSMTFIIQAIAFQLIHKSALLKTKTPDLGDVQKRKHHESLIIQQFEQKKIHLNDGLSLQEFSEAISLPPAYVSQLINQGFNCSFKKLIAKYRVEEAKQIMNKTQEASIKLIDVAYDAGFNNKVSFYRSFKEFEQMSPSEYLESIKK